jgi:hypothetical protein
MTQIHLDHADVIELGQLLTFAAEWLSSAQKPILAESLAAFVGRTGYHIDELCSDLHRFLFLLGVSDGEQLFGEPTP